MDSALQSALADPRERLALLKLEDALFKFYHSSEQSILVSGVYSIQSQSLTGDSRPASSFHRMLVHRLADRFGMARDTTNEGILVQKTSETKLPERLTASTTKKSKKRSSKTNKPTVLMKNTQRSDSTISNNSHASNAEPPQSARITPLEDKEQAYAEARARILGHDNDEQVQEEEEHVYYTNDIHSTIGEQHDPDFVRFDPRIYTYPNKLS